MVTLSSPKSHPRLSLNHLQLNSESHSQITQETIVIDPKSLPIELVKQSMKISVNPNIHEQIIGLAKIKEKLDKKILSYPKYIKKGQKRTEYFIHLYYIWQITLNMIKCKINHFMNCNDSCEQLENKQMTTIKEDIHQFYQISNEITNIFLKTHFLLDPSQSKELSLRFIEIESAFFKIIRFLGKIKNESPNEKSEKIKNTVTQFMGENNNVCFYNGNHNLQWEYIKLKTNSSKLALSKQNSLSLRGSAPSTPTLNPYQSNPLPQIKNSVSPIVSLNSAEVDKSNNLTTFKQFLPNATHVPTNTLVLELDQQLLSSEFKQQESGEIIFDSSTSSDSEIFENPTEKSISLQGFGAILIHPHIPRPKNVKINDFQSAINRSLQIYLKQNEMEIHQKLKNSKKVVDLFKQLLKKALKNRRSPDVLKVICLQCHLLIAKHAELIYHIEHSVKCPKLFQEKPSCTQISEKETRTRVEKLFKQSSELHEKITEQTYPIYKQSFHYAKATSQIKANLLNLPITLLEETEELSSKGKQRKSNFASFLFVFTDKFLGEIYSKSKAERKKKMLDSKFTTHLSAYQKSFKKKGPFDQKRYTHLKFQNNKNPKKQQKKQNQAPIRAKSSPSPSHPRPSLNQNLDSFGLYSSPKAKVKVKDIKIILPNKNNRITKNESTMSIVTPVGEVIQTSKGHSRQESHSSFTFNYDS